MTTWQDEFEMALDGGQMVLDRQMINAETGEIVEAEDAFERHQRIVALRHGIESCFLELGHELYDFSQAEQWRSLGHKSLNAYLADPDVDIGRRVAFMLIGVYKHYQKNLAVQPVALLPAGYSKLDMLRPYMTPENVDEWLDRAAALSRSDLGQAIKAELKPPPPPLPPGKYRVIYADPPWKYGDILPPGYGAATHHYETMSAQELCDFGVAVKDLAADDAVLFMWATSPMLKTALEVMTAWGFAYKTSFVWDKVRHNFGYYNSVRHEFLLIGGRGHSTPDSDELKDSVVMLERSPEHSEKPEQFREMIDSLYTYGTRIELFARREIDGWDAWGDEV